MEESKIQLSVAEMELACNAEIILTKNRIINKTIALFETIQDVMLEVEKNDTGIFYVSPKISKGEYYLGLPYVVLDYPRLSASKDLCFIRTMFWWGHFFSSTLQLSGAHKQQFTLNVTKAYSMLAGNYYYIGVHKDPWQHHFESDNYQAIANLSQQQFQAIVLEQQHIKIAAKWPLQEWNKAASKLLYSWKLLTGLIT
ncbi:MAG TPA: hypothetical protein VFQ73_02340 [Flavisolibacter sp.]|nr:hypothetical protein [Flavisolibacter sp.]